MSGDLFDELLRDIPPEPSSGPVLRRLVHGVVHPLFLAFRWAEQRTRP